MTDARHLVAIRQPDLDPPPTGRALQGLLCAIALIGAAVSLVLAVSSRRSAAPGEFGFIGYQAISALAEGWVGYLIATRQPKSPVGWAFLASAVAIAIDGVAHEYALRPLPEGALPIGRDLAIWIDAWVWAVSWMALALAVYRFPDGRPVSPGWLRLERLSLVLIGVTAFLSGFAPGPTQSNALPNPYSLAALSGIPYALRTAPVPATLATLLAIASLFTRFRHSRGAERQQLKWLVSSSVMIGCFAIGMSIARALIPELAPVAQVALVLSVLLIPISIGIAVLRYRLYDIDVLINRTLVYAAVTATLAATFFGGLVLLQALLRPITGGNELAVAISTLLSFALFQPVRRQVQDAVDRRFDRARYDAARTLDAFAERLRDEVDLDELRSVLLGAVRTTMAPTHTSLWLRERTRLRPPATTG